MDEKQPRAAGPYADQSTSSPTGPAMTPATRSTPTRITRELGWQPSVTVEEGLRRTVDWYLANRKTGGALCRTGRAWATGSGSHEPGLRQTGQVATEIARRAPDADLRRAATRLISADPTPVPAFHWTWRRAR